MSKHPGPPGASRAGLSQPSLWEFRCSHYCEKVRWALDWKRIEYATVNLFPGWHAIPTLIVSRGPQVPLLRVDGRTLRDSTRILEYLESEYAEPALYPSRQDERARAVELEDFFDGLGPSLRRVHYSLLVPHLHEAATFFSNSSHGATFELFKLTWGRLFRPTMGLQMGFDDERVARSKKKVETILERFEAEVQASGYLVGDGFGVADLTLASLLSTLIYPAEFPYPLPVPFPESVLEYSESLERYAALDRTRDIYAKHRISQ